mgnify:CR=1 FL=1
MADVLRAVEADGSVVRVWRGRISRNRSLYVQVNSGPPTWWIPQVRLRKLYPERNVREFEAMVGWLRVCAGVTVVDGGDV